MSTETYFDLKSPKVKVKQGLFTHCYIHPDYDYVILHSDDLIKESMALFFHPDDTTHLPEIKQISNEWYVMPKYQKLTSKHKKAYAQYKLMLKIYRQSNLFHYGKHYNYDLMEKYVENVTNIDETLGNAVGELLYAVSNCTSYVTLDVLDKDNFSVDNDGNLILRDIFADTRRCISRNGLPKKILRSIGELHDTDIVNTGNGIDYTDNETDYGTLTTGEI